MIITVDSGGYVSAMDLMYRANRHTCDAALALSESLGGFGAMSGTDAGGRDWATAYDEVATTMVGAGADLGGSIGAVANLLNVSLLNHEGADYGAQVYPTYAGGTGDPDPYHASERFSPGTVPSTFGGVGGEPHGWHWLVEHLHGLTWPDADTTAMRAASSAWSRAGTVFGDYAGDCVTAASEVEAQRSPEAPIAAHAASELAGHCDELAAGFADLAVGCRDYADHVESHHREVLEAVEELMAWTVVDQVTGAALSLFTGGGSEVAAQLVESGIMAKYAERVMSILRRLLDLARAAASLIGRSFAKVTAMIARLKVYLSVRTVRLLERAGTNLVGRRALNKLPADVRQEVENAMERARSGKIRFQDRDGKEFENRNPVMHLPAGRYREWTAAANGQRPGAHRIIIEGDPASPRAIYYWDHGHRPVRIGP